MGRANSFPDWRSAEAKTDRVISIATRKPRALLGPPTYPSILEQTKYEVGFYKFFDEGKGPGFRQTVEYFNPAIVEWRGRDCLITRRREEKQGPPGQNRLMLWPLTHNTPGKGYPIAIKEPYAREHQEDPRALNHCGTLILSWCNFRWNATPHQCLGELTDRFSIPNVIHPVYGKNGPHLLANRGPEKNWTWFFKDGLFCVYVISPAHVVFEYRNRVSKVFTTPGIDQYWGWGELRGGSNPVLVDGEYVAFVHSSQPWLGKKRRYFMGAYAFEPNPPFRITRVSRKPILIGSENDPRNLGAPVVVFPCGAVFKDGTWLVSMGINDCRCAWIRLPHADLLNGMRTV